jgi:hypothetical protein
MDKIAVPSKTAISSTLVSPDSSIPIATTWTLVVSSSLNESATAIAIATTGIAMVTTAIAIVTTTAAIARVEASSSRVEAAASRIKATPATVAVHRDFDMVPPNYRSRNFTLFPG